MAKGHPHFEDIVRDPTVTEWIDNYARRIEELTEPEWLRIIGNPESRWSKDKTEYSNLFKLGKRGPGGQWQA